MSLNDCTWCADCKWNKDNRYGTEPFVCDWCTGGSMFSMKDEEFDIVKEKE